MTQYTYAISWSNHGVLDVCMFTVQTVKTKNKQLCWCLLFATIMLLYLQTNLYVFVFVVVCCVLHNIYHQSSSACRQHNPCRGSEMDRSPIHPFMDRVWLDHKISRCDLIVSFWRARRENPPHQKPILHLLSFKDRFAFRTLSKKSLNTLMCSFQSLACVPRHHQHNSLDLYNH